MIIAPCLLKWRTVAARYGEADILKVERSSEMSRILRVAEADSPRPAIGMVADQSGLAEIGIDMCESLLAQHVGDAIGDEPLTDRIQRDAHPRTPKGNPARADIDEAIIDQLFRHAPRSSVDVGRRVGAGPEISRIKLPE